MTLLARHYDKHTGRTEEYHIDPVKGTFTIRAYQDVTANLNFNKEQYNMHDGIHYGDSDGLHKVASIPFSVIEGWKDKGFDWFNSTDRERRNILNLRENKYFKVRPGKL